MTLDVQSLAWDKGLVAVVAQDRRDGAVRMVAFANQEAVTATLQTGVAHFYSRSRKSLWKKGESSGNTMQVHEVFADCDRDALIYLVTPQGPTCHTGAETCFSAALGAASEGGAMPVLAKLEAIVRSRRNQADGTSYTQRLLEKGPTKIAEKIREEGDELAVALTDESNERVVSEAADVLYHLVVGLESRGVSLRDVSDELAARFGVSGLEEKASR